MSSSSARGSRVLILALGVLLFAPGFTALAQAPSGAIARYFARCHAVRICNGAFLVTQHGKVVYDGALGAADADQGEALTPHHQFDIGSISKQFAAAAILHLAERGQLALDDPAKKFPPDFPYPDITLRQLLTHTSGVPDVFPFYTTMLKAGQNTAPLQGDETIRLLTEHQVPLRFTPGSAFEYSNTGYILLSQVVAKVAGSAYADFLQNTFFGPLGMTHTRLRLPATDVDITPRAYGFTVRPDGARKTLDQIPNFYPVGAGGIYSTTGDLRRWADALEHGNILSKASWTQATTPARLADGTTVPYGFGLKLEASALGQSRITHGGDWRGFKADLTLLPAQGVQIVMLTNNGQDDSVEAARDAVEAILAGKPHVALKESVHWQLFQHVETSSPGELKTWLLDAWNTRPRRYDFPGQPLEQVAGELLKRGQADKAVAVLEFNVDVHPTSPDARERLADAYLERGDRQAAVRQVEKMLELKPASKRIRARLAELKP